MAKAKSNKPSDKTEAEDAKPDDTAEAVTETGDDTARPDQGISAADADGNGAAVTSESEGGGVDEAQDTSEASEEKTLEVPQNAGDALIRPKSLDDEAGDDTGTAPGGDDLASEQEEIPAAAPVPVVQEKVVERKGGFVPALIGGVVAAALGFGAAQMDLFGGAEQSAFEQEARATIEAQSEQIAQLQSDLEDAKAAIGIIDLQPLTTSVGGVEDSLSGLSEGQAALESQIAAFDSRLTAVEKAPVADAVGPEAIAAYERELEELRQAITAQKQAVEQQKAEIKAMAEEALANNAEAEGQATLAASRGAAAEVIAMAQEGKPYATPLEMLSGNGVTVPDVLASHAEEGVTTLTALATDFPDVARDALAAARRAGPDGEGGGGIANFLSNQLGARSVQPRAGDDPDAILSRAEAAVKDGDLDAALTEIAALPQEAQAELSIWTERAEARRDVLAAAQSLAQDLNNQ
ncbi:COG4223 family protein [Primorskyibacter sp. 2E107]|uniref:COG4223 family protein n=1 Tax=Primorskyibacter sp. 2E107 TaxID=3403458 RepID=UPI003AF8CE92